MCRGLNILLGFGSQFGQYVSLGIVLSRDFCQYNLVKVGLTFTYLFEVFHHPFSLSFKLSLDLAHYHLRIAPDLYIRSSHLSSYGQSGQNGFILRFIVCGDKIELGDKLQLDSILELFTF
jgi:hypothetical protein